MEKGVSENVSRCEQASRSLFFAESYSIKIDLKNCVTLVNEGLSFAKYQKDIQKWKNDGPPKPKSWSAQLQRFLKYSY